MATEGLVGRKAPNFLLTTHNGKKVKLSELKGKNIVLVFYCKNNTPGWNRQLSALRDDKAQFEQLNTEVFGVNDAKVEGHKKYADNFGFNFNLLSDTDKKVSKSFAAIKDDTGGIKRTVVILDKEGVIRYHEYGMPENNELLDVIKTLK